MDRPNNSRFWLVCLFAVLGAGLYFSKEPLSEVAPPPQDASRRRADPNLVGGVTQLKVEDLQPGTGRSAQTGDQLSMNYRGTLLDGSEFDSSYDREPFNFTLGTGAVIKGWDEGLVGMKEGGKRKLTIPANLGYGDKGSGAKIPGGATLVFEVELLKVGA